MLEYGIKTITTNPTLITKASEIIRLVDSRTHKTRAFVLPVMYEPLVEKLSKELEYKLWVQEKKKELSKNENENENLTDVMDIGLKSVAEYLGEE